MCRLTKEEEVKLRRNAITSTYQKTTTSRKELTLKKNTLWKMQIQSIIPNGYEQ